MKAVRWYAPRDMRYEDSAMPSPKPWEALVRIGSVGVCGSDMHYYLEGCIGSARITAPLILGHEYSGVVEAVGSEADPGLVGARVAVEPGIPCMTCEWCRKGRYNICTSMTFPGGPPHDGALCEYIAVNAAFCFPIPDSMSMADAAMIEPLAVALHSVELGHVQVGDSVAILGLGPIGLLTAEVARCAGAGVIYGTDLLDYRVAAGRRHGVHCAFNADREDTVERLRRETNGRGVDVVFDCARSSKTIGLACHVVRPGGRVVLTGISGAEADPVPVGVARRKELTLQWCRRFVHNFPAAIALAASGTINVSALITHSFPLERTHEAFELVANYEDGVLKASIDQ